MWTRDMYTNTDGAKAVNFCLKLAQRGASGAIAVALFRAYNNSSRAKKIRRGRRDRYDKKDQSVHQLDSALVIYGPLLRAEYPSVPFAWGWGLDEAATGYEHVLYVDLPNGQVSFHNSTRGQGPAYSGVWDQTHRTGDRIADFCDRILDNPETELISMPFGRYVGTPLVDVPDQYVAWMQTQEFSPDVMDAILAVRRAKANHPAGR